MMDIFARCLGLRFVKKDGKQACGTGFWLGGDLILTAAHLVEGDETSFQPGTSHQVVFSAGMDRPSSEGKVYLQEILWSPKVAGESAELDVALVRTTISLGDLNPNPLDFFQGYQTGNKDASRHWDTRACPARIAKQTQLKFHKFGGSVPAEITESDLSFDLVIENSLDPRKVKRDSCLWGGISGAPVFSKSNSRSKIIGVVSFQNKEMRDDVVSAIPIDRVLCDEKFKEILGNLVPKDWSKEAFRRLQRIPQSVCTKLLKKVFKNLNLEFVSSEKSLPVLLQVDALKFMLSMQKTLVTIRDQDVEFQENRNVAEYAKSFAMSILPFLPLEFNVRESNDPEEKKIWSMIEVAHDQLAEIPAARESNRIAQFRKGANPDQLSSLWEIPFGPEPGIDPEKEGFLYSLSAHLAALCDDRICSLTGPVISMASVQAMVENKAEVEDPDDPVPFLLVNKLKTQGEDIHEKELVDKAQANFPSLRVYERHDCHDEDSDRYGCRLYAQIWDFLNLADKIGQSDGGS
ncbi:MAG: serine protease [Planctomycetota bacterium]|nr:MAG: serine protease [Planctomycetota bacterium]